MSEAINSLIELWRNIWSFLGPISSFLLIILILYIHKPERFERIAIHVSWALSWASKRFEKSAISREVRHLIRSGFTKNFAVEEVPEIVVE